MTGQGEGEATKCEAETDEDKTQIARLVIYIRRPSRSPFLDSHRLPPPLLLGTRYVVHGRPSRISRAGILFFSRKKSLCHFPRFRFHDRPCIAIPIFLRRTTSHSLLRHPSSVVQGPSSHRTNPLISPASPTH